MATVVGPRWLALVVALLCLALSGCRTDPAILALERENRVLDDQVWYLSDQLDITLQKLESTKAKLAKCQEKAKDAESAPPAATERPSTSRSGTSRGPSLLKGGAGKNAVPDEIATPEIVVPSEALPPGQVPKSLQRSRSGSSRFGDPGEERPAAEKNGAERPATDKPTTDKPSNEKPTTDKPTADKPSSAKPGPGSSNGDKAGDAVPRTLLNPPARKGGQPSLGSPRAERVSGEPARLPALKDAAVAMPPGKPYRVVPVGALAIEASADSSKVQSITLHRLLTGGLNLDGQPGDEGVSVVIEPRDAQGNVVAAVGAVSLLALDPELPRDRARVARWDLSAREVAPMFRRLALGASGLALELFWPGAPPQHGRLELIVRFTTSDGRDLEAHQQITITPPGSTPAVLPASALVEAKPMAATDKSDETNRHGSGRQTIAAQEQPATPVATAPTVDAPSVDTSSPEGPPTSPSPTPSPPRTARPTWSPNRS